MTSLSGSWKNVGFANVYLPTIHYLVLEKGWRDGTGLFSFFCSCYKRALNWYCIYSKVIFDWILCIIQLFSMCREERRKQTAILVPEWL